MLSPGEDCTHLGSPTQTIGLMAASYGFLFLFGMVLIDLVVNGDRGTNWLGFALIGVPLLAVTVLSTILWRRVRRRAA